jgi:hypothetical protein
MIIAFFVLYYAFSLTVTRLRAELGTPVHDFHATGPDQIMADAFGMRFLRKSRALFFGLIIGQFVVAGFWSLLEYHWEEPSIYLRGKYAWEGEAPAEPYQQRVRRESHPPNQF